MAVKTARVYVGAQTHKPRGCWPHDPTNPTGEVCWLASTDYEFLLKEYSVAIKGRRHAQYRSRLRAPFVAKLAEDYRTRSQPVLSLDESALRLPDTVDRDARGDYVNLAAHMNATEIPGPYLDLVVAYSKRAYFTALAEQQEKLALLPTIHKHYRTVLKDRLLRLGRSGAWVPQPEMIADLRTSTVMVELNQLVLTGLGFEHDTVLVSKDQTEALANPLVRDYLAADHTARRQLWQANHGVLSYLLNKARVPTPGKYRRTT